MKRTSPCLIVALAMMFVLSACASRSVILPEPTSSAIEMIDSEWMNGNVRNETDNCVGSIQLPWDFLLEMKKVRTIKTLSGADSLVADYYWKHGPRFSLAPGQQSAPNRITVRVTEPFARYIIPIQLIYPDGRIEDQKLNMVIDNRKGDHGIFDWDIRLRRRDQPPTGGS